MIIFSPVTNFPTCIPFVNILNSSIIFCKMISLPPSSLKMKTPFQPKSLFENALKSMTKIIIETNTSFVVLEQLFEELPTSVLDELLKYCISTKYNLKCIILQSLGKNVNDYIEELKTDPQTMVLNNNFSISEIFHNIPLCFYEKIAQILLDNEILWDEYFYDFLQSKSELCILDWDWTNLNLDQYLAIRYFPNRFPEFCSSEYVHVIMSIFCRNGDDQKRFCSKCCDMSSLDENFITHTTRIKEVHIEDLIDCYFRDNSRWCFKCNKMPLFELLPDNENTMEYVRTEIITNCNYIYSSKKLRTR